MKLKYMLVLFGISCLLTSNIILYITFLNAYFHGYKTTVMINVFGEAHLEFVLLHLFLIFGFYALYQLVFNVKIKKGMVR